MMIQNFTQIENKKLTKKLLVGWKTRNSLPHGSYEMYKVCIHDGSKKLKKNPLCCLKFGNNKFYVAHYSWPLGKCDDGLKPGWFEINDKNLHFLLILMSASWEKF